MKMKTIQKNQKSVSMTHIQQVGMMMKQLNCITKIKGCNIFFIFFLLILSSSNSFSQVLPERYQKLIDSARIYRSTNKYKEAVTMLERACAENGDKGLVQDRYEAGRLWALIGNLDSVENQFNKIVKVGYGSYIEIEADSAFKKLENIPRWKNLKSKIKANYYFNDSIQSNNYESLDKKLIHILDTIYENDQLPRMKLLNVKADDSLEMKKLYGEMSKNDSENQNRISLLLDSYGWLGAEKVSQRGINTVYLVLQHAPLDIKQKYIDMVERAVSKGEIRATDYALFQDRYLLQRNDNQKYGTQVGKSGPAYYVLPIQEPAKVDEFRSKIGLPPMKEYLKRWKIIWSLERYEKDLLKYHNK